ncbi:hypothetical protein [Paenibacillus sp. MZ03-122A]|uniref:hypothetical protein n=1 Tax=Paenibacillus sp. MZ03-122A TaxID=2962033 RepID=UPI0020B7434C|nr:hypothetical protein [Paenibacillus sp. MZ03-122A]MCP3779276.1 hypothetical protein [Paenibacillus sp. MZ03-122A]
MLEKSVLLLIVASFLFMVNVPDQAFNHHHSIPPQVTSGGVKAKALLTLWLAELLRYRNSVFVFAAPIVDSLNLFHYIVRLPCLAYN